MANFLYNITALTNNYNRVILKVDDLKYDPMVAFFSQVSASLYPDLIKGAIEGYGIGLNVAGVTFPGDYEEWEEGIPENMVEFGLFEEEVLVPRMDYLEILLAAAKEMLAMQLEHDNPSDKWVNDMKESIRRLETYIANPDFTP